MNTKHNEATLARDFPVYRNIRWELGGLGHVCIVFPDPMPPPELLELEELVTLWLRSLRRRGEAAIRRQECKDA